MKRTFERELKVLEIAALEAHGTSALVEIAASGCAPELCSLSDKPKP